MPETLENVRVVFESDTSSLEKASDVYTEIIGDDKQLQEQVKKSNAAMQQQGTDMSTLLTGNKKSIEELSTAFKNLDKNIIGGTYKKVLGDIRKELQLTDAQAKAFYKNLIKNSQQGIAAGAVNEDLKELQELIAAATTELNKMGNAEEQTEQKTVSLKAQLRAMKEELTNIDDPSNPRFIQLSQQAAELEDRIGDTREQVRLLASDTRHIDAAIQTVSGLAGAFAVAQGAAALFGSENEEVQQALLKVNAAMSILQGLQQIQALVDKNSALNILLINSLREKQVATTVATATVTKGLTVAEKEATIVQEQLNVAMAANPAAVLLLSLTALVSIMYALSSSTNDAADAQEKLNTQLDYNKKFSDDTIKFLDQAGKERLAKMKSQGASEQAIREEERRQLQDQLDIRKEDLQKSIDAGEDAAGKLQDLAKNNFQIITHYNEVGADGIARDRVKRTDVDEKYLASLKKTQEDGLQAQRDIDSLMSDLRIKDFDDLTSTNKEIEEAQKAHDQKIKEAHDKAIEEEKKYVEAIRQQYQALSQFNNNNLTFQADQSKKIADDTNALSTVRIVAFKQYLKLQTQAIQEAADDEISINGLTGAKALVVRQKAQQDILKLTQDTEKQIGDIRIKSEDDTNAEILAKREAFENSMIALGDETTGHLKANRAQEVKDTEDSAQKRQAIETASIQVISQLGSAFFQGQKANYQNQEQQVQDLADKKLITEKEAQSRINQLRRQEAAINKQEALFNIFINTAVAAAKAASQTGVGASIAIPIVEALGLALAAIVSSKSLPQYKKGGFTGNKNENDVVGVVHGQEFVAHAEATKRYKPALEAMHNLQFEEYLNKYAQTAALASMPPDYEMTSFSSPQIDYDKLSDLIGEKVAKHSKGVEINFDERGIVLRIKEQSTTTEYLNKKYKYKA